MAADYRRALRLSRLSDGLYSIDPSVDFLAALARGLVIDFGNSLGEALLLLPSRRACLGFRSALTEVCADGEVLAMPRLLPINDVDCLSAGLIPEQELAPAIDPLERELVFASFIKSERRESGGITDEHALRLARELASLLDELQDEEVEFAAIKTLVPDAYAGHWQRILQFLNILAEQWPRTLDMLGRIDPSQRRRLALDHLAARWKAEGLGRPVIAAGMTGTIPAVARLLAVIERDPEGTIVLPGIDIDMSDSDWRAVGAAPTHPQHGFAQLLERLDANRSMVRRWPYQKESVPGRSRTRFLTEIMRPAETSELWRQAARPSAEALSGLEWIGFADQQDEAKALVLMIREALEHPRKRIALVTADRNLARSVTHQLREMGIDAADSAGTPLDQTTPGSFIILAARAIVDCWSPVAMLALLKHPLAACGRERTGFRRLVRALERRLLRGPRAAGGLVGLRKELDRSGQEDEPLDFPIEDIAALIDDLIGRVQCIDSMAGGGALQFAAVLREHLVFCAWLASDENGSHENLWARAAGDAAAQFIGRLQKASPMLPAIGFDAFPVVLAVLMSAESVRDERPGHPRVDILGQLESRLLNVDKVLIAGLQEGVWPRTVEPSPWLNRAMRVELGLPPVETRIGFAAHDFFMCSCRPEVTLTHAARDWQSAPAPASRWLSRLSTVLRAHELEGALESDVPFRAWARQMVKPDPEIKPVGRPMPSPPAAARPRDLSVTDIETLVRDPYGFYARRILRIRPLDPIDADPGAAERGMIIHAALERFVRETADEWPRDPLALMIDIGSQLFATYDFQPQVRAIWWPRFLNVAQWFVGIAHERRKTSARVMAELVGAIELRAQSGPVRLQARADRVELGQDGTLSLIDYKTGTAPKRAAVAAGVSPQLTLTALIAREGGFKAFGQREPGVLAYWEVNGTEGRNDIKTPIMPADYERLIEEARNGVSALIDYFSDPAHGYPATPRPEIARHFNEFDHLERIDEWRGQESNGDQYD